MGMIGLLGTGQLGVPFVCSDSRVLTFSQLTKKKAARFASHAVIGQKPVLEYVGPDTDTITMRIRLDAMLGVPPSVGLMALERMVASGQPHLLLIGMEYHGQFVITSLDVDNRHFTGSGVARIADVQIELKEVADGGITGLLSLFA